MRYYLDESSNYRENYREIITLDFEVEQMAVYKIAKRANRVRRARKSDLGRKIQTSLHHLNKYYILFTYCEYLFTVYDTYLD